MKKVKSIKNHYNHLIFIIKMLFCLPSMSCHLLSYFWNLLRLSLPLFCQLCYCRLTRYLARNGSTNYMIMNKLWLSIYSSMNTFLHFSSWALALQNILDTLSDVLDKCLCFSLIKIESVSLNPSHATLGAFLSVVYIFLLKMLSLVLIKN